jgi:hypothetical protein
MADYDFRLGKNHLRGTGWRGLIALMMILIFVTTTVGILVIPATPASVLLFRFLSGYWEHETVFQSFDD